MTKQDLISMFPLLTAILQAGTEEVTNILLILSGVPFVREGSVFHLEGHSIVVAPECGGIKAGFVLFVTLLLAGILFLKSWWKRIVLATFAIPITMFTNGIRIVVLSLLGTYVDVRFFHGSFHIDGGIPFFILSLLMTTPLLLFLRKRVRRD